MVSHGNPWPSTYPKLVTGRNRSINRQNIEIMNDIGPPWMEVVVVSITLLLLDG